MSCGKYAMKKNTNKKNKEKILVLDDPSTTDSKAVANGIPDVKDMLAPAGVDLSDPSHLKVGDKFVRSLMVQGYPKAIGVGFADQIMYGSGDIDVAIHMNPMNTRDAITEMTKKITQFEAQYNLMVKNGDTSKESYYAVRVNELKAERARLEQNITTLFGVQVVLNLHSDSLEALNKETQKLSASGQIKLVAPYLAQEASYKSALPFGESWMPKAYRTMSSEALTAFFPFYNGEISHEKGVFLGVNTRTATPIYIDFYDRKLLNNGNVSVFGEAGSGKTFFVSLLTMRSALMGIRTAIIDPEGEYESIAMSLGGKVVRIAPESGFTINPFDIEDEDVLDEKANPTGKSVVRIKEKVADLLNLIGVMVGGDMSAEQKSLISTVLSNLYDSFGFTEDPKSLYEKDADLINGEFLHTGKKKVMPTFSEFHEFLARFTEENDYEILRPIVNTLKMFKSDGVYGLFDCHTSDELSNFKEAPVVSFDVSHLEENVLRPIGMYVAMSWVWEKFAKKNIKIKKRVVCDEAWMLLNKNMAGYEYTGQFLETLARRIRKRNGGLLIASQSFLEFVDSPQGKAVLNNSQTNIFMKPNPYNVDDIQEAFHLSAGEKAALVTLQKGLFLMKIGTQSVTGYARPFSTEQMQIEKNTVAGLTSNG